MTGLSHFRCELYCGFIISQCYSLIFSEENNQVTLNSKLIAIICNSFVLLVYTWLICYFILLVRIYFVGTSQFIST